MKKFFTKKEAKNIIELLSSKDQESIRLGFSLIQNHRLYKAMKKIVIIRYYYYDDLYRVPPKYTLESLMKIYYYYLSEGRILSYLTKKIKNFVNKRTYHSR